MIERLRENLPDCAKLEIAPFAIEDYLDRLERYDLALAANVLSGVEPIDEVLWAVARRSTVFSIVMWSNAVTPPGPKRYNANCWAGPSPIPIIPTTTTFLACWTS
jgi:hypothetical protein